MAFDSSPRPTLPVLSHDNFNHWKLMMRAYLMEHNLISIVTGSETSPTESDSKELKDFLTRRRKAAGIIIQHLSYQHQLRLITDDNFEDAREIWKTIMSKFESNSEENQAKVFRRFIGLTCQPNNLPKFLDDIRRHLNDLRSVGITYPKDIKEILIATIIISKLPASMTSTKEILLDKRPLTIKTIFDHIEEVISTNRDDKTKIRHQNDSEKSALDMKPKQPDWWCINGAHNPKARHSASECYTLYPELRKLKKRLDKLPTAEETLEKHDEKQPLPQTAPVDTPPFEGHALNHLVAKRNVYELYTEESGTYLSSRGSTRPGDQNEGIRI